MVTPLATFNTPTRLLPLIVTPDALDPSMASGVATLVKSNGEVRLIVCGVANVLLEKTMVLGALPGLAGLTFTLMLAQATAAVIVPTSGPRVVVVTRYDELASNAPMLGLAPASRPAVPRRGPRWSVIGMVGPEMTVLPGVDRGATCS